MRPLISTTMKRTRSGDMPVMLPTNSLSRSISTAIPITTAVIRAASSRMILMMRFEADRSVGARGELRTRSIHDP